MRDIIASGLAHSCNEEDLSGCLFFHVKDELMNFASRARDGNVHLTVTQFDAGELAWHLMNRPTSALDQFTFGCFDRIDMASIMDHDVCTPKAIMDRYAPFLNKGNPYATMFLHSSAWGKGVRGARVADMARDLVFGDVDTRTRFLDVSRRAAEYLVCNCLPYPDPAVECLTYMTCRI